jgi:hypothetical protein
MKGRKLLFGFLISSLVLTSCMSQEKASYPVANLQKKSFGFIANKTDRAEKKARITEAVQESESNQLAQEGTDNITPISKKDINTILIESQEANTLMEVRNIVLASSVKKVAAPFSSSARNRTPVDNEVSAAQENISKYSPISNATSRSGGSGFAIVSFIAGILGLLVAGIPLGIIAVVFGAIGLKRDLKGLAIAGIILGFIDIVGALIVISML